MVLELYSNRPGLRWKQRVFLNAQAGTSRGNCVTQERGPIRNGVGKSAQIVTATISSMLLGERQSLEKFFDNNLSEMTLFYLQNILHNIPFFDILETEHGYTTTNPENFPEWAFF